MSPIITAMLILVPAAALMLLAFTTFRQRMAGKSAKKVMRFNLVTFLVLAVLISVFAFVAAAAPGDDAAPQSDAAVVDAQQQTAPEAEEKEEKSANGLGLLAAGLVTGLAGIGGGIAVAAGAPAAIAATSEDPKSFGKSLIFVALGESIALYGVVISILILNKV